MSLAVTASDMKAPEISAENANIAFDDIPYLEQPYISTSPENRNDSIPVKTLVAEKNALVKLAKEIAENKHDTFDSMLISHKGELVFESYYRRGRINLPHYQQSATKSYTSLAIGRAIELGYLSMDDLEKPITHFLKDLNTENFAGGIENITLAKAMTMRSGLDIDSDELREYRNTPERIKGQLHAQRFFELTEAITPKSQSFSYKNIDTKLAMQIIEAVVPGSAIDFIKTELLDKLGINNYVWEYERSGLAASAWGTGMTSRNMLKWGMLVRNKGSWNGEQLVPEAYITKMTSIIVEKTDVPDDFYGYFWWMTDMAVGDKTYYTKSARGGRGQYILLVDDLDLIIVFTSHNDYFDDKTPELIEERILPVFVN